MKTAHELYPLTERFVRAGLRREELPKLVVLQEGKTFLDLVEAWRTRPRVPQDTAHQKVVRAARYLRAANIIKKPLV